MPSKEEMAKAYIEQVKNKIAELSAQLEALNKHLEECELELTKPEGNENENDD